MNFIRINDNAVLSFSDGKTVTVETPEDLEFVMENLDNEEVLKKHFNAKVDGNDNILERVRNSKFLEVRGASVIMPQVSNLTIPKDFVEKVLDLEEDNNYNDLSSWVNFWTLVSKNPNAEVRDNIFWFIRKWGIKITPAGLLICYRNAVRKNGVVQGETTKAKEIIKAYYFAKYIDLKDPEEMFDEQGVSLQEAFDSICNSQHSPMVFTDQYSGTTTIKLGQPVKLDISQCDTNSECSCSRGLHVGAAGWLKNNYFGDVGLQCLVSPSKVVAVPTIDDYGKMRCCEYLPVNIVEFDEHGNVVEPTFDISSDLKYLEKMHYEDDENNEIDCGNYTVVKRSIDSIYKNLINRFQTEESSEAEEGEEEDW